MSGSAVWRRHFQHNAEHLLEIPWHLGADLTAEEAADVATSIQEFQAGESSEGRHLYRLAQQHAARTGDYDYLRAIRLFIAEEQRHALCLGRFLTINNIPLVHTTFADRVFRRLRGVIDSLEISIAVLVTAELIAKVYYAALRDATGSRVLRRLCDQILADEDAHVRFQCDQLRVLRSGRSWPGRLTSAAAQRVLFGGTVLVVWWTHQPVLRRGRLSLTAWWARCWREFVQGLESAADHASGSIEKSEPTTAEAARRVNVTREQRPVTGRRSLS